MLSVDWCSREPEMAQAQYGTIRLKLFKIGAVILCNTRRVRFLLSSADPYQDEFFKVAFGSVEPEFLHGRIIW